MSSLPFKLAIAASAVGALAWLGGRPTAEAYRLATGAALPAARHGPPPERQGIVPLPPRSGSAVPRVVVHDCPTNEGYAVSSYVSPEPGSPEVHVIGVYETRADHSFGFHPQGTAEVVVERSTVPLVLVLSSYEPTRWVVRLAAGVDLQEVVLNGYNDQEVQGVDGVPVVNRSGKAGSLDGSYSHEFGSAGGLLAAVEDLLGVPVASFSGCYRATQFTVLGR